MNIRADMLLVCILTLAVLAAVFYVPNRDRELYEEMKLTSGLINEGSVADENTEVVTSLEGLAEAPHLFTIEVNPREMKKTKYYSDQRKTYKLNFFQLLGMRVFEKKYFDSYYVVPLADGNSVIVSMDDTMVDTAKETILIPKAKIVRLSSESDSLRSISEEYNLDSAFNKQYISASGHTWRVLDEVRAVRETRSNMFWGIFAAVVLGYGVVSTVVIMKARKRAYA